ncbi:MAG: glycine betaine/L-proline ABC transporter ATP-binding protein [Vibrio sp.]
MVKPYIQVTGLYKIFGANAKLGVESLKQGKSKEQLMTEQQLSVGLNNISLSIGKGETFVVMGLSGSGKSTLIRHFNRLIEPTEGRIEIGGIDICSLNKDSIRDWRRKKMSMVFQRFGLLPHKTVLQNVAYGLQIQGEKRDVQNTKAQHWIDVVGLTGYESQYPNQLSGGQQQRVGLARALCTDPDILLMDEAFSALDPLIRSEMQLQLKNLQQELHKTIIFITHDLDEALRLGDQIAILKDGELVQQGKPMDILFNPTNDYVASFVKDINKPRALSVKHAMQTQAVKVKTSVPIKQLLKKLDSSKAAMDSKQDGKVIYLIDDEGKYIGSITQKSLAVLSQEIRASKVVSINDLSLQHYIDQKDLDVLIQQVLRTEDSIEAVVGLMFAQKLPLPVVNSTGQCVGSLGQQQLFELLTGEVINN